MVKRLSKIAVCLTRSYRDALQVIRTRFAISTSLTLSIVGHSAGPIMSSRRGQFSKTPFKGPLNGV